MEFRILGPLEVRRDGQALALGGTKQRALLAILLIQANKVVAVDRLAELLWADDPPATAVHAIEVYVSQLRRTLEPDGAPFKVLLTSPGGYSLRISSRRRGQ
jgi:DNA-binding SARP family transcriptional activator